MSARGNESLRRVTPYAVDFMHFGGRASTTSAQRFGRLLGCLLWLLLTATAAEAQRGQDYVQQQLPTVRAPGSGFPGLFDTELAKPGGVVMQVPALTVHVGITEHLTLGTSVFYDALSLSGNPGGLGWLRYRVRGTARVQSTVDAIGGGFRFRHDGEETRHTLFVGISNTSVRFGTRHQLTLNVLAGNLGLGFHDSSDPTDVSVTGIATGATYTLTLARWCALSATVLPVPLLFGHVESPSLRADINLVAASEILSRTIYRAMVLFRAGERWSFEVGAFGVGALILPWLSIGLKTR